MSLIEPVFGEQTAQTGEERLISSIIANNQANPIRIRLIQN